MIAAPSIPAAPSEPAPHREPTGRTRDARPSTEPVAPATAGAADHPGGFTAALADAEEHVAARSNPEQPDARRDTARSKTAAHRHKDRADTAASATTSMPIGVQVPATSSTQPLGMPESGNPATPAHPHDDSLVASAGRRAGDVAGASATPSSLSPETDPTTHGRGANSGKQATSGAEPENADVDAAAAVDTAAVATGAAQPPGSANTNPSDAGAIAAEPMTGAALRRGAGSSSNRGAGDDTSHPSRSHSQGTSATTATVVGQSTVHGAGAKALSESHSQADADAPAAGHQTMQPLTRNLTGDPASSGQAGSAATATAAAQTAAAVTASAQPASFLSMLVSPMPTAASMSAAPAAPSSAPAPSDATGLPAAMLVDLATPAVGQPGWAQVVAQAIVMRAGAAGGRLRLQVQPPNLGPVDIALSIHNASATIQIVAQHPLTQAALQQSIPQLHTLLGQHGVQLARADVTSGQSGGRGRGHDAPPTPARVDGPTPGPVQAAAMPVRIRTGLVDDYA